MGHENGEAAGGQEAGGIGKASAVQPAGAVQRDHCRIAAARCRRKRFDRDLVALSGKGKLTVLDLVGEEAHGISDRRIQIAD
jgi:hypothetical protein